MSKVYTIKTVQKVPISLEEAWDFFSKPSNLAAITPDNLGFNIVSKYHGERMYPGQIIEYTVKPVLGIPPLLDDRNHPCGRPQIFCRRTALRAL